MAAKSGESDPGGLGPDKCGEEELETSENAVNFEQWLYSLRSLSLNASISPCPDKKKSDKESEN